jgi:hypothetical protein
MEKYAIRDGQIVVLPNAGQFKANVQAIGETLAEVARAHDGRLEAEDVVEAARDPASPLHNHFEWDDSVAAHQYRLTQARQIIRVVRVETGPQEIKRAFISARTEEEGRSYRTLEDVVSSGTLQRSLLADAERDLTAWLRRYGDLVEVAAMAVLVEEARVGIAELVRRQTTPESESAPA